METNAFHPSEMSLGSLDDILVTTSNLTTQDSSDAIEDENKPSLDISSSNVQVEKGSEFFILIINSLKYPVYKFQFMLTSISQKKHTAALRN